MTEIKKIQNRSRIFVRRLSAFSTILFGFFTIFFVAAPKILTTRNLDKNISTNFFIQNAYADIPVSGGAGCAGDSACASGCAGACADGSAGACSCGDGVGSASSDATA